MIDQIINPNSRLKAEDQIRLTNEAQRLAQEQGLDLDELIQNGGFYSETKFVGKGQGTVSGVAMKNGRPVYDQDNAGGTGHKVGFKRK